MDIKIINCLKDNFSYLILDKSSKDCCVVDPGEAQPIIDEIEKKKLNLKFILNTHHHYDHIGGNSELKKKFSAKIVGFHGDLQRIPGIDISVKENDIWEEGNFKAKIIHTPGHTLGHICFYFFNEKVIFTGDTLFSLGCGRIFEGTHMQMFNSLQKLKTLPPETKIFCGHEYTLQNSLFCLSQDKNNNKLKKKIKDLKLKLNKGIASIPSTIQSENLLNIFLKTSSLEDFSKLRNLKDNF